MIPPSRAVTCVLACSVRYVRCRSSLAPSGVPASPRGEPEANTGPRASAAGMWLAATMTIRRLQMNHLGRFFAISAFSLGLTSVASAQPPAPQTDTAATPARSTLPPRPLALQHPILAQRRTHHLRYAHADPRI